MKHGSDEQSLEEDRDSAPADNKSNPAGTSAAVTQVGPVERERFGAAPRRDDSKRDPESRGSAPITSAELRRRGPAELAKAAGPKVNWRVFSLASAIILAFSLWAMLVPDSAQSTMKTVTGWISANLGWFYVLTITCVIVFVLWVALSKEGSVRLGPDHSRPQYKMFTWMAMLFAAGVGIDMLFYSVTGPISHYLQPPHGEGLTPQALQDSVVWTMFHYGIAGWSMYSLLGMAMGYFAYRWGMPLSIRAALYPLLGKRVRGVTGDVIDTVSLVGTIFGVATSMGIGVVLLNVGFSFLFGLPEGLALQIALVIVAVVMTIAACTSGVDKGIRLISELNLWSAGAMLLYILITGKTSFLLNSILEDIGRFAATLPSRTLQTMAYEDGGSEWMAGATLFFWAFWLAWGPFVGLFLARISRGRTLREFVLASITVPVLCDFLIVTIFGNSALSVVLGGNMAGAGDNDMGFAKFAIDNPEGGFFGLLEMFPGAPFLIGLATLSGLLFYLTSANSGAMVMSNFSSSIPDPADDGPKWLRIFWAVVTAVLTIAMLVAGGVTTMEYATLIFALPVTVIAYLVMASFSKVLRMERAERAGQVRRRATVAAHGGQAPEKTWRQRLAQLRSYPTAAAAERFLGGVVDPALTAVAQEFRAQGYAVQLTRSPAAGGNDTRGDGASGDVSSGDGTRGAGGGDAAAAAGEPEAAGIDELTLLVTMDEGFRNFLYSVKPVEAPIPAFGGRSMSRGADLYYRLEVFTQTGSEGYDLMGLDEEQIISDVLDRYEDHLAFLEYSTVHSAASVITPPVAPPEDAEPFLPEEADDVERVDEHGTRPGMDTAARIEVRSSDDREPARGAQHRDAARRAGYEHAESGGRR